MKSTTVEKYCVRGVWFVVREYDQPVDEVNTFKVMKTVGKKWIFLEGAWETAAGARLGILQSLSRVPNVNPMLPADERRRRGSR